MKYSHTSIIRGPRLSAVFDAKIQYAQVPRIIEVWLYINILHYLKGLCTEKFFFYKFHENVG